MDFEVLDLPRGTNLYYSSAKFREQEIYAMQHRLPVPAFPSQRNFFVASSAETTRSYGRYIDNPEQYYGNVYRTNAEWQKKVLVQRHTVHAYKTTRIARLLILNEHNVNLLLSNRDSPFHISKFDIPVTDINLITSGSEKSGVANYIIENWISELNGLDPYDFVRLPNVTRSGFALLMRASTIYKGTYKRDSSYLYDYTLADLINKFLKGKVVGWYQPSAGVGNFHEEIMICEPEGVLERDTDDLDDWTQHVKIKALKRRTSIPIDLDTPVIAHFERKIRTEEQQREQSLRQTPQQGQEHQSLEQFQRRISAIRQNMERPTDKDVYKILNPQARDIRGDYLTQTYLNKMFGDCRLGKGITSLCKESGVNYSDTFLSKILDEMMRYPNAQNRHHYGKTVGDHSVWVARTIYNWLKFEDDPWTSDLSFELRPVVLLSAFLHDIGKIGDRDKETLVKDSVKPEHPTKGFQYLSNGLIFRWLGERDSTFEGHSNKDVNVILLSVIQMHHFLGEILMKYNENAFTYVRKQNMKIDNVPGDTYSKLHKYLRSDSTEGTALGFALDTMVELKYIMFMVELLQILQEHDVNRVFLDNKENMLMLIKIICAVSAADVFGSYPVSVDEGEPAFSDRIKSVLEPTFLRHETSSNAQPMELHRPFYVYLYNTLGLKERDNLLAYAAAIHDYDMLVDAWVNIPKFINYIMGKAKTCPAVYKSLEGHTGFTNGAPEKYIKGLLRLLKCGYTQTRDSSKERMVAVKEYLNGEDYKGLEKYIKHRVPGLEHLNDTLL